MKHNSMMDGLANLALTVGGIKQQVERLEGIASNGGKTKSDFNNRIANLETRIQPISEYVVKAVPADAEQERRLNAHQIYLNKLDMDKSSTTEDITGIADNLRDCTARLDSHGRSLDNISARLDDHKETINFNARDGEDRLSALEVAVSGLRTMAALRSSVTPTPPPEQPTTALTDGDCWAIVILYVLVCVDILIHLFK